MAGLEVVGGETRMVRIQSLFRAVNDRALAVVATNALGPITSILCECGDDECIATIPLSMDEYESIRRFSTRFAVLPGHVAPTEERIVERTERYTLVEKFGRPAALALRMDPRLSMTLAGPVEDSLTAVTRRAVTGLAEVQRDGAAVVAREDHVAVLVLDARRAHHRPAVALLVPVEVGVVEDGCDRGERDEDEQHLSGDQPARQHRPAPQRLAPDRVRLAAHEHERRDQRDDREEDRAEHAARDRGPGNGS